MANSPTVKSFLSYVAPGKQRAGTQGITKSVCVHRLHQTKRSQTWPFWGRMNLEKIVFSYKPLVCQALHRDDNGSCPSSSLAEATQFSPLLNVPWPPKLPALHQRPGECPEQASLCANSIKGCLLPHPEEQTESS